MIDEDEDEVELKEAEESGFITVREYRGGQNIQRIVNIGIVIVLGLLTLHALGF